MSIAPRNCERIVLIGWGAIGTAVARLLAEVQSDTRIVAVAVLDPERPRSDLPGGARLISEPSELRDVDTDLVIEVAGRDSVAPWAREALGAGVDFVVSSASALADAVLLDELRGLAQTNRAQLIVQPGALGGVDALAAARHMGLARVEHRIVKPPRAWAGTEAESLCALNALDAPVAFFTGTAAEAAKRFPQNANVALTTALAGIGPERTRITLIADPAATLNRHEITASGDFGTLDIQIANSPLPENPKSSAMTALNLVRLIGNRKAGLVV